MTTAKSNLFLVAVALFVSGMLLGIAPVRADELPADTNKIESLTPERARKLATEFSGVSVAVGIGGNSPANPRPRSGFGVTESRCLPLNGLKSIDKETAKELAGYAKGPLLLDGLTTLDADTATALVEFKHRLYLDGLTTLDAETAKGFANVMFLNLAGLSALDARTAKVLAASPKWNGQLPKITTPDSVVVAKALATRKGPLSLPNIKKISPKTLSALIEKRDVEIPLVETLEFIAEPDGSETDDFVIPAWLEERQRSGRPK